MYYRTLSDGEVRDLEGRILYEDNHLLVVNKRAGEIVQGDRTGDECLAETLKAFVAQRDAKPGQVFMGIPHRLDRPVSGIVVFAKTSKALERLAAMFREGEVHKTYWALCCAAPPAPEGELEDLLVRNEKMNKSFIAKAWEPRSETRAPALPVPRPYRALPPGRGRTPHRPSPPDPLPACRHGLRHQGRPQVRRSQIQSGWRHIAAFTAHKPCPPCQEDPFGNHRPPASFMAGHGSIHLTSVIHHHCHLGGGVPSPGAYACIRWACHS